MLILKRFLLSLIFVLATMTSNAQAEKMKAVFEVTSSDINVHTSAVRHVKSLAEAYPNSQFEMVIYGNALSMMLKGRSSVHTSIEKLVKVGNVSLRVCAIALKKHEMTEQDLISGVKTVPDGLVEVIEKQAKGWAYIKESN